MCQNTSIPVALGLTSPAAQRMSMFMHVCMCDGVCVRLWSCGYHRKWCSGLLGHGSRSLGLSTVICSRMVITYCKNKHHYHLVLLLCTVTYTPRKALDHQNRMENNNRKKNLFYTVRFFYLCFISLNVCKHIPYKNATQLLIFLSGQIVRKKKRFTGTPGEKVGMTGVIQERWSLADPADVWSIHGTSGPQHTQSISLDFSFLDFHCSSRSTKLHIPPCGPQIFIHNRLYYKLKGNFNI